MERDLDMRIELMKENLIERGRVYHKSSQQVENDIASFNFSRVAEVVKESVKNNNDIKYAVLMDVAGKAIIHTQSPILFRPYCMALMIRKRSIRSTDGAELPRGK